MSEDGDDNPLELVTTEELLNELGRRYETIVFCGVTEDSSEGESEESAKDETDDADDDEGSGRGIDWHVAHRGNSWLGLIAAARILSAHIERDYFSNHREKPEW